MQQDPPDSDPESASPGSLAIGPGQRLGELAVLFDTLLGALPGRSRVRLLTDTAELLEPGYGADLCLLDADSLPPGDLGILTRFLERNPEGRLVLVGEDPTAGTVRRLCARAGVSFRPWPLDVLALSQLAQSAAAGPLTSANPGGPAHAAGSPSPTAAPGPGSEADSDSGSGSRAAADTQADSYGQLGIQLDGPPVELPVADLQLEHGSLDNESAPPLSEAPIDGELAHIESILAGPSEELAPPLAPEQLTAALALGTALSLPPYFKDQIADLADIAQRVALSNDLLDELGSSGREAMRGDVVRLLQFTRTLGYLAAPPPRGDQIFDLSRLLQELVTGMAQRTSGAPRFLFQGGGALSVRSTKSLLTQAFDALLFLAQSCAEGGRRVRVETRQDMREGAQAAQIGIEFPAGPLDGFPLARVFEPYALRRRVPDLGANALAAAAQILAGQGGELRLSARESGHLAWTARLPLVHEARAEAAAEAPQTLDSEGDPFA